MKNPLIQAVIDENIQEVKRLLQLGADPNGVEDNDRITPLHFVAQKSSAVAVEIAGILIKAGANPLAFNQPDGQTPLEIAQLMSSPEMRQILSKGVLS